MEQHRHTELKGHQESERYGAHVAERQHPQFCSDDHTDNYGKYSYNDRLSLRRATTVTNLLASVGILRASI
ncbi:hypothetical protein M5G07_08465 [Serratia symbiotica]|nr:hypothetical protein [Serratia symbiotica]